LRTSGEKVMSFVSFFFSSRRRHTRWPRDWSSDVCSSDLANGSDIVAQLATTSIHHQVRKTGVHSKRPVHAVPHETASRHMDFGRSEERRVGKECRSRWSPDR